MKSNYEQIRLSQREKISVFSIYYGAPCKFIFADDSPEGMHTTMDNSVINRFLDDPDETMVVLLLYPLDDIPDEIAENVGKLYGHNTEKTTALCKAGRNIIETLDEYRDWGIRNFAFQYLVKSGCAVPLFFGIKHPANGKTAIELGLAEKRTRDAVEYKSE